MSGSLSENAWGGAAGQQRAGNDRMPVGFSHLLLQAVHGRREPHVQKDGGIDVPGFGIGRGLVEKTGQIAEIRHEHADRSFVKRDGHVSISPAGTALMMTDSSGTRYQQKLHPGRALRGASGQAV
jgi:hypothetical protein